MIDIQDSKVQEVINGIHQAVEQKLRQAGRLKEETVRDSQILSILARDPDCGPTDCARRIYERYGENLSADQVIRSFGFLIIRNPKERAMLMRWADKTAGMLESALPGDKQAIEAFTKASKEHIIDDMGNKRKGLYERALVIAIYEKYPELDSFGDKQSVWRFGNVFARFFLFDILDAIATCFGLPRFSRSEKPKRLQVSLNQATETIHQLEDALERTNAMLHDLQTEFDEQLENSKVIELTDFFAQLNSGKYGNILDQLLATRKGVDTLRRNGFQPPIEINGLLIMVAKLTQFVRDTHINPVLHMGTTMTVKAADIESYEYEGKPFLSQDEQKQVIVISPGWIYKDKEVMISRPKVREDEAE